ncbi:MAG: hypothetical protein HY728_02105, partial [Candidatus Rokubacteria bacterium]|nr:hypothetical protein [Candidatus Rokubacteria bacterium]
MRNVVTSIAKAMMLIAVVAPVFPAVAAEPRGGPGAQAFEHVHALAFDAQGRALWLGAH